MPERVATVSSDGRTQTPQPRNDDTAAHPHDPPDRRLQLRPRPRTPKAGPRVETSDRLEPFLGYKLNQAGVSAIEKTYDSERRRNIDTADVVAFARCFQRPIGWFFLPPPKHGGDLLEPLYRDDRYHLPAAELVALTLGTPHGWQQFLDRITELLKTDRRLTADALHYALDGQHGRAEIEDQINLRRQAIRSITLARHATPADDVIKQMAELLVKLVNLTPPGMDKLRVTDPDHALLLLEEGEQLPRRSASPWPTHTGRPATPAAAASTTSKPSTSRRPSDPSETATGEKEG